ncbi:MAG: type II secretion system F family protein [Candidatus Omnitrophica bacterium]|nr:type II secretion system F family protein [Candidatus Omnitrophota bacterium]
MPTFTYKARDSFGELISGAIEGDNKKAVAKSLNRLGYSVIQISLQKSLQPILTDFIKGFRPISKQEITVFTRQLATLSRSGMAISPALSIACEQTTNPKFRLILGDVVNHVQGGMSLSEALSKYPEVFSDLFVNMVKVGETGGILDKVLDRLVTLSTQELERNTRIRSALIYPIVLVAVAFLVVNFLLIGVLPKFVAVFRASQARLPLPTQLILSFSWILRHLWLPLLIGVGCLAVWFKRYIKQPAGRYRFDSKVLKLPLFGKLYTKIMISRFTGVLSALIASGVPLLQALGVVEKTITNMVIRRIVQNIRTSITEGQSLAGAFKTSGFFPPMVVQMISVGEKTGKLDEMLRDISSFYDPEIEYTIRNLTTLLEPFMLLAMGAMVAFIALSVLLPIFNLIKVFRG